MQKDYYNNADSFKKYGDAIDKVGLWKSEKMIFNKYVRKENKILDLGCGAGRTTINLYKLGYKNIIGYDISEKLLSIGRKYCLEKNMDINFYEGDAANLAFDIETFDVVFFSYNGLMCIPKEEKRLKVLKEIYRVLKKCGKFIFTAHDRESDSKNQNFWAEEKTCWNLENQNPNIYEYGDMLISDGGEELTFVHMANIKEIKGFIGKTDFRIAEYKKRSEIADESEAVKNFSGDTVFWILEKN